MDRWIPVGLPPAKSGAKKKYIHDNQLLNLHGRLSVYGSGSKILYHME